MKLNDKRIQAYTKTFSGSSDIESSGKTVKKMRTHIDELMERDGLLKLVKKGAGRTNGGTTERNDGSKVSALQPPVEFLQTSAATSGAQKQNSGDSVYRRVAKFLLLIGVNEAAKIIPHLTPAQTEKIVPEIASIRSVDPDEASAIFAEFQSLSERSRQSGGVQTAFSILEKAFGTDKAQAMLSKTVPYPEGTPFDYLQEIDEKRLTLLLKDESVPVQTLVLSRLKPALAASFIKVADQQSRKEIISRLAKLPRISAEVVRRTDRAMREKLQNLGTESGMTIDGRTTLAEILKKMTPDAEKSVLSLLSESDPELSEDVRNRLFSLSDILHADDRFIQETLRTMSDETIAVLIADKDQVFREKILKNMSKGRGDIVLEEEQLKKPVSKKNGREITDAFFAVLRRAWEDGKLVIRGRNDDVYV